VEAHQEPFLEALLIKYSLFFLENDSCSSLEFQTVLILSSLFCIHCIQKVYEKHVLK